jgi:uncharacterized protein (DUF1684 family)
MFPPYSKREEEFNGLRYYPFDPQYIFYGEIERGSYIDAEILPEHENDSGLQHGLPSFLCACNIEFACGLPPKKILNSAIWAGERNIKSF